jgi:hypothetical protein
MHYQKGCSQTYFKKKISAFLEMYPFFSMDTELCTQGRANVQMSI